MEACLIVTYRCNAKCYMCNTWQHPSKVENEFTVESLKKIPDRLKFINITGGEPFLRDDLESIVKIATEKSKRVVISSNGYFTEKIIKLARQFGNQIGIRVSIEGLPATNDELRGIKNGFDHGLRTIIGLLDIGITNIGFGITVSDRNAKDMMELYRLAKAMNLEFATATTHNSYYFHKQNNRYINSEIIAREFEKISVELLKTNKIKNWFRAYFNMGLANKVRGGNRPLPCEAGTDSFFMDPYGNILACNGSDNPMILGNLNKKSFKEIWHSQKANDIRRQVKNCTKECWMIGSVSPAIKKKISVPSMWVIKNKLKIMISKNKDVCLDAVEQR